MKHRLGALCGAALALALAACASNDPPPLLLTLPSQAVAAGAATPAAAASPRTLVLRRVGLPEYLLTRRVRFRDSESTLADWPNVRWAERIEVATTRELAEALRARLPGWTVCEATCADGAPGELVLHVDFARLDLVRHGGTARPQLQVVAQSSAVAGGEARWRDEQRLTLDVPAATPPAHAAAIGEALRGVARALAARVAASAAR